MKLKINDINGAVNQIHKIYFSRKYKNLLIYNSRKLKIKINRQSVVEKVLGFYEKL